MNVALIAVIAILILGVIAGAKKGFIRTVFALCSTLVAILLTVWLNPFVNNIMQNNETIMNAVAERVEKNLFEKDEEENASKKKTEITDLELPEFLRESLIENNNSETYKALKVEKENMQHYVCLYIATMIVKAISFVITFLIVSLILWLICHLMNIVARLPILNGVNTVLGTVAGAAESLVVIWLLCVLLATIAETELGLDIYRMIEESKFLTFIYENNLIIKMMQL